MFHCIHAYLIELNIAHAAPNPLHHHALFFFEPALFILSSVDFNAHQCNYVDVGDALICPLSTNTSL